MKVKKLLWALLMIGFSFSQMGCVTRIADSSKGVVQNVQIAVKDFIVVGPIRYSIQIPVKNMGQNVVSYDRLLEAAYRLGGDDVINVRVDKSSKTDFGGTRTTYIVNALAIKYTDTLHEPGRPHWQDNALPDVNLIY